MQLICPDECRQLRTRGRGVGSGRRPFRSHAATVPAPAGAEPRTTAGPWVAVQHGPATRALDALLTAHAHDHRGDSRRWWGVPVRWRPRPPSAVD